MNTTWIGQILQTAMNIFSTISTILDIAKVVSGGDPVLLIIQVVLEIGLTCIGDHHVDNTTVIYYNSDLNSSNPLPGQFKRVEVIENAGANGKTVYEFTSSDDYAIWKPANPALAAKQRFAYWAYGLPKKITVLDVAGNPVKETENIYDTINAKRQFIWKGGITLYQCAKSLVIKSYSQASDNWTSNATAYQTISNDKMLVDMYEIYTGHMELKDSYERIYKQANPAQFLQTATHYNYNSTNYEVSEISTTQSNGDINYQYIKYSIDYSGGALIPLNENNVVSLPVATTTAIMKSGNPLMYLGETVTEFLQLATGDIKPSRTLVQRFNQPQSNISFYQGPDNSNNPTNYKEVQTLTYDAAGNLIGIKDEGKHVVTNIYDYNDKYVAASVVNAEPLLDKSAYTSFETDNFGGWVLNGPPAYITPASVTGSRSFSLSGSNNLSAMLNTAKPCRLSLWTNNIITVTNAILIKSAPVINGFTYYEYNINQGTSTVTVSGNAYIDELRLCPQAARMRTVTYDPLIGKTAECDENNRITYYEYDEQGRLRFIKDEHKNVTKMYEYNIAKKPTGCPVTYFNLAVSEIFIKNNCTAGYMGSIVTYTIPEGRYTSTISRDAVDQQVQNELNANGQAYANTNGSCIPLFSNAAISQNFTKEGCDIGYEGTTITYTVPAGRYTSTESQADADEQAQDDIDANGQAFANFPGNASCVISYTAVWIGTGLEQCQNGNKMVQVIDQNPNSSSYNQTQWVDTGADATCGSSGCDSNSCSGEDKRCVGGFCETGYKVYTHSDYVQVGSEWKYRCTYHYEFIDGFWSADSYEYSDYPCVLN